MRDGSALDPNVFQTIESPTLFDLFAAQDFTGNFEVLGAYEMQIEARFDDALYAAG